MKARTPMKILLVAIFAFTFLGSGASGQEGIRVQKALLAREVETFGIYTEESSHRFQAGARTIVYVEVADFMLVEENGNYALDVALDISILDPSGEAIFEKEDVVAFDRVFRSRIHDLYFKVDLGFQGWPAGEYTLALYVRDNQAGLSSKSEMTVEIFE